MNVFKVIPIEVFGHDVVVSIGQTDEDLYEEIEENTSKKDFDKYMANQKAIATTHKLRSGCILIRFKDDIDNPGIVAHEAFHAVVFLFKKIGIEYAYESEEAYAYTLEYLTNKILKIKEDENMDMGESTSL
jgi:DNA primase